MGPVESFSSKYFSALEARKKVKKKTQYVTKSASSGSISSKKASKNLLNQIREEAQVARRKTQIRMAVVVCMTIVIISIITWCFFT